VQKNNSSEQQKILELLYSGKHANDLLAFELLQHVEDKSPFFLPFVATLFSYQNEEASKKYFDFIKPNLNENQQLFIKSVIREGRLDWDGWAHYLKTFNEGQLKELAYISFKRTGFGFIPFLILDNGEHPSRREVFEGMLKRFQSIKYLNFSGLYPNEIDEYMESQFESFPDLEFSYLVIDHLKETYFPKSLKKAKIKMITNRIPIVGEFPKELLEINSVNRLSININEQTILPSDWSGFKELESIDFGGANYVFKNINFVHQCPNLKQISVVRSHSFSHPDILLGNRVPFHTGAWFESIEGYFENKIDSKISYSIFFISSVLGKSDFSIEKQKEYLIKFSNQNLWAFTLEELQELSTLDFGFISEKIDACLSMKKFYPN